MGLSSQVRSDAGGERPTAAGLLDPDQGSCEDNHRPFTGRVASTQLGATLHNELLLQTGGGTDNGHDQGLESCQRPAPQATASEGWMLLSQAALAYLPRPRCGGNDNTRGSEASLEADPGTGKTYVDLGSYDGMDETLIGTTSILKRHY